MVEAWYGGVQTHLDRLIGSVTSEIARERAGLARLEQADQFRLHSQLLVLDLVLANLLLWLVLTDYALYWITASFFLYVVFPFLLLIPSSRRGQSTDGKSVMGRVARRFEGTGLARHRWVIGKIFWNSFFINLQPLAPAFLAIYSLNILFAFFPASHGLLTWLIVFQSATILVFYLAIAVLKPYTSGFLESLIELQDTTSRRVRRRVEPLWKVVLPIGLVAGFVAIVLIAAMLLPGFTLGVIWNTRTDVAGIGFLPVLFVLASQVVVVRYSQGDMSRRLVRRLRERKVAILTRYVLRPLEDYRDAVASGRPEVLDRFAGDFSDIRATFISSKVYLMQSQDLGGLLPVHVVVPDLDLVLNPETIRVFKEQPESRQIL